MIAIAKVVKEFYQDPATDDANWVVVDLAPVEALKNPVSLEQLRPLICNAIEGGRV